ncbi:MAG: hypothetical protein ACC742_14800 [Thermoanaerobaculales bacterium]
MRPGGRRRQNEADIGAAPPECRHVHSASADRDHSPDARAPRRSWAQRWSRRIYEAFPDIEGISYPSSMCGGAPAIALYERAADAIPGTQRFHRPLADPALLLPLENAAQQIGYAIV